jgi:hypothetical protein
MYSAEFNLTTMTAKIHNFTTKQIWNIFTGLNFLNFVFPFIAHVAPYGKRTLMNWRKTAE